MNPDLIPSPRKDVSVVLPSIEDNNWMAEALREYYTVLLQGEEGLAYAVGQGIARAKTDIIVVMDADGNHPISYVPRLLEALEECELACGVRRLWPPGLRGVVSRYGNNWACRRLKLPVSDCTSGFFAARREHLQMLPETIFRGYGDYYIELVYCAMRLGWALRPVPVEYAPRIEGKSHTKLLQHARQYYTRVRGIDGTDYRMVAPGPAKRGRGRPRKDAAQESKVGPRPMVVAMRDKERDG